MSCFVSVRRVFSRASHRGFRSVAACVLERLPIVAPSEEPLSTEDEKKRKSYPDALIHAGRKRDVEEDLLKWNEISKKETERSMEAVESDVSRRPDARLVLFLQDVDEKGWKLPHATHQMGETIRGTATRALEISIGDRVETYFVGNCPFAHVELDRSEYGKLWNGGEDKQGTNGEEEQQEGEVRLFLHKAQLIDRGEAVLEAWKSKGNVAWVALDELHKYVKHPKLAEVIYKGLV